MRTDTRQIPHFFALSFNGGVGLAVPCRVSGYKLAAPRIVFFLASICHAITDPPVTKIRLWASFGV